MTLLHLAAKSGNIEMIKAILDVYSESDRLQVVNLQNKCRRTALLHVAGSGNLDSLKFILSLSTESGNLAMRTQVSSDGSLLHHAAQSGNFEPFNTILNLYPESECLKVLKVYFGKTVLHYAAQSGKVTCTLSRIGTLADCVFTR